MTRQERLEKCAQRLYELRRPGMHYITQALPQSVKSRNANDDWEIAKRLEPDTPGSASCSEWSFADQRYVDKFFDGAYVIDLS